MGRFLLYFSYIGTKYSGLQKQIGTHVNPLTGKRDEYVKTVLGTIEAGLGKFRPIKSPHIVSSSRTDRGVHALCNTAHVDLKPTSSLIDEYNPDFLCYALNKYLNTNREQIRMGKVLRVSDNFHSRHLAKTRKYCYRLAICENGGCKDDPYQYLHPVSIFDRSRVRVVNGPIDIEKVKEGAKFLSGTMNYFVFTSPKYFQPHQDPVKTLNIEIQPSNLWMGDFNEIARNKFKCYDFIFTGNSFMYRMVRKMVSCLLGIGQGHLTLDEVQQMMENPGENWVHSSLEASPPYALYLLNVEYDKKDLPFNPTCPRLYLSQYDRHRHNALFGLTKILEAHVEKNSGGDTLDSGICDPLERLRFDEKSKDLHGERYLDYLNKVKSR